jgi:uncharacterized protein
MNDGEADHDIYSVGTAVDRHRGSTEQAASEAIHSPADRAGWHRLSVNEARVLGALIEKQLTTPDIYPLSLNALTLACNQSTNREPVMALTDTDAIAAMTSLKERKLARFVHPTSGRGVTKYRQVAEEPLGLGRAELAVLGVLLLRGPQTSGEVRLRTERAHNFDTVTDVERALQRLHDHQPSLVVKLERQPGHKEARWQQLFADEPDLSWSTVAGDGGRPSTNAARVEELGARVASLEALVEDLQTRLARLEDVF